MASYSNRFDFVVLTMKKNPPITQSVQQWNNSGGTNPSSNARSELRQMNNIGD